MGEPSGSAARGPRRAGANAPDDNDNWFSLFKQQKLPACRFVLTPVWVISIYLLMAAIFIPVGLVTLHTSRGVVELVDRYDLDCVPDAFKTDKLQYIKNSSIPKNCSRFLKIITIYLLMAAIFILVGLVTLHTFRGVVECVDRYDLDCVPDAV